MNETEFMTILRQSVADAGTPYKWCQKHGVPRATLSRVLTGKTGVPPMVAGAMGMTKTSSADFQYKEIKTDE